MPILFFLLFSYALQNYTRYKYLLSLKWVLLEVKPPKEVRKSPKAMEQVFAGLHGAYIKPVKWYENIFLGKVLDWFSFEMVGKGGETHFYIRAPEKYKNVVEAQVYAQYPESEIVEVPDYVYGLPRIIPDNKYDLWGAELMLNKEDAYPIRTYPEFEEKSSPSPDEVKRIDPLASLSELFGTLHPGEQIWIQIVASPVGDGWIKRGQAVLDKLMGKPATPQKGDFLSDAMFAIDKAISSMATGPAVPEKEKKEERRPDLSPGKQELLKAIEKSWDKLGYETVIRFAYIGLKEAFHQAHVAGIMGAFRQFSSQNLNGFRMNKYTLTHVKGLFKRSRLFRRKVYIYQAFKERKLFNTGVIRYTLNTEELATIYHYPDVGVKAPLLPRVEAKKGEPPAGLPIN